jgi:type III secretion protein D
MPMQNSNYKLRWLNGMLAGREFLLPEGELRLGGADADVAVVLEADAQALLTIDERGVTLASATDVWVDGAPWSHDEPLPVGPAIDVAGQAFVLGRAEDTLPMLAPPVRGGQASEAGAVASAAEVPRERWPMWVGGGAAALLLCVGVAASLWPTGPHAPPFDARAWVDGQLKQAGLAGVRATTDRQGAVVLSGRCKASADVDRLRQRLQERELLVRDETICEDTVRQAVRQVLASNGYDDATVESGAAPDTVVISGDISADRRWERTAQQLAAVHGLSGWTVANDSADSFDQLIERLGARGLLEGIAVTESSRTLWVTARAAAAEEKALRAVVDEYNAQRGEHGLPAQFQNMAVDMSTTDSLPAPIVGVGGNAGSIYVELANGMRLQKGAVLPSGYTVYALTRSWITLRRAQRLISLRLDI